MLYSKAANDEMVHPSIITEFVDAGKKIEKECLLMHYLLVCDGVLFRAIPP